MAPKPPSGTPSSTSAVFIQFVRHRSLIGLRHCSRGDIAAAAHEAIVSRDWATVRHLLHPYLHWTRADGVVVRGRSNVLVMLQGDHSALGLPRRVELRDGQIYRWLT